MSVETFVYVIGRPQGPVKIGMSIDPERRAKALQPGCPFPLRVLHRVAFLSGKKAYEVEQQTHEILDDCATVGEWFDVDADYALDSIRVVASTIEHFEERRHGHA